MFNQAFQVTKIITEETSDDKLDSIDPRDNIISTSIEFQAWRNGKLIAKFTLPISSTEIEQYPLGSIWKLELKTKPINIKV